MEMDKDPTCMHGDGAFPFDNINLSNGMEISVLFGWRVIC